MYVYLNKNVYETNYQAIALIIHILVLVVFINIYFFLQATQVQIKKIL